MTKTTNIVAEMRLHAPECGCCQSGADEIERLRTQISGLEADKRDARRYRWLRDGNAYAPEEEMVSGGEQLDELCDGGRFHERV